MTPLWLPYANVTRSLATLHRDEVIGQLRMFNELLPTLAARPRRPSVAVTMWRGYEAGAVSVALHTALEYERRYGADAHSLAFTRRVWATAQAARWVVHPVMPRWFGYRPVHASHQSVLMRQRPEHYARLWPHTPLNMPVLWPANDPSAFGFTVRITEDDRAALVRNELSFTLTDCLRERME